MLRRRVRAGADRWVISHREAGLGDRIMCLGAAWRYARLTGRTLVADWRLSNYSPDPAKNAFTRFFEPVDDLAGVPFVADVDLDPARFPRPRHPSVWNRDDVVRFPPSRPAAGFEDERVAAVELIRAGRDVKAATVVFDACVNDGLVAFEESRTFLAALQPVRAVRDEVTRFRRERLGPGPAIGLHVRHGNGGDIMGHTGWWVSFPAAIERCVAAVTAVRATLGAATPVLLCTDSAEVQRAIGERVAGTVCRHKTYRAPGDGELHGWRGAFLGAQDALVEMLLLAECDVLVRYPPASFFSFWGAVMKPTRLPPPPTVYDLQHAWDAADPLSPAVLW